jgi:quercetin dioxygenase-like cupin family protein
VTNLGDIAAVAPRRIWDTVTARVVEGERLSLAMVELAPDALVPEHRHDNEQLGLVLDGEITFRVGDETRVLGPGGTWRILGDVPHEARAGADGAVVIDVFAPVREDWAALEPEAAAPPRWPRQSSADAS